MAARPRSAAFSTASTQSTYPAGINPPSEKRKKMSITQTYYLAHTARGKLSSEASRPDHNLRLLVGHANLLDGLMADLADAEQEQEKWFNQTVKGATTAEQPKHIQWADAIVEEPEDDWAVEDAESDSDSVSESSESESDYDDAAVSSPAALRRAASPPRRVSIASIETDDDEYDDDEEDNGDLALIRTPSRQPPELLDDSDDSSEDESMPPSPPQLTLDSLRHHSKSQPPAALSHDEQTAFIEEGFYLPQRNTAPLIRAY